MWNLKYDINEPIYKTELRLPRGGGQGWIGSSELADADYYTMNEQDPPVQHRELYSISCEKP